MAVNLDIVPLKEDGPLCGMYVIIQFIIIIMCLMYIYNRCGRCFAKYTCPKCNIRYCTVNCYKEQVRDCGGVARET